ncbi:MAG: ATP-dependent Clp protease proteolytic subunit [Clostridia bacterium]|nr:ATP-dependent Clp protease proteolytic subunit [Clostridia bacterium]
MYYNLNRQDNNRFVSSEHLSGDEDIPDTDEANAALPFSGITDTGSIISDNGKYVIQFMTIIGQIEGHYILSARNKTTKYEHIIPQLIAVEQSTEIQGLLVLLNTVGGDVEAGLAIAELMAGMKKPVVSLVLGGGHSIGVPIAVAAKKSFIARSATMTIHPVRMSGMMLGVPQAFEYFQRMQRRITDFVTAHSKISAKRYNSLALNTGELVMDIGTILDGETAVSEGLINSIGSLSDAVKALCKMIDKQHSDHK